MNAVSRRFLPLAAAGLAACAGIAAAASVQGTPGLPVALSETKITICHATGSESNPYVQLSVDYDSIFGDDGHGAHVNDIIPPFDYVKGDVSGHYPGRNWPAGEAIWANGCRPPDTTTLPIQPIVKCVDVGGGTLTAVFGYSNPNSIAVDLNAGSANNSIEPGGDRGQPSTFQPGTVESAVTVTGAAGATITWTIRYGGQSSSASADASFPTRCTPEPPPTPRIEIFVKCVENAGSTFSATFAYVSSATGVVNIPVGSNNSLDPAGYGSPPTSFQPGGEHTFTIAGITTQLAWTLITDESRTATATADYPTKCTTPPAPVPIHVSVTCIDDHGATFSATFGYTNDNETAVDVPSSASVLTTTPPTTVAPPTHFQTGTVTNALSASGQALSDISWSVTYAGETSVAVANESFPTKCGVDPPDPPDPYRIGIFVTCVTNQGATYSATFGYESEDTEATSIPVGERNRFFPPPEDRQQPTTFETGNVPEAFTVDGISTSTDLTWSVTSDVQRHAEASADFPVKCGAEPDLVPIGVFVTCVTNHAATYDAVFGYTNDNRAQQIVPLGLRNTFLPAPGNRAQPTTFEPGTVRNAVTVRGIANGTSLAWSVFHVRLRVAVANEHTRQKCDDDPLPPDPPTPEPEPPPRPPDPKPPPPDPRPPEFGLSATCILRLGSTTTYDVVFGYVNASQENVTVPVGRRNFVSPTPLDRGQPSIFRPGVVLDAFAVQNVPRSVDLTWTVRLPNGEVRTATATARYPRNCITQPAAATADLVLRKSVSDASVIAGQRVTYTLTLLNRGPNIAFQVRVVDVVDPRLELLSASTTRGSCTTSGRRVACTIAALPPGAPVRIVIAVRVLGAGAIRNVARASHSRRDPTPENNVASAVLHAIGRAGGVEPGFTG